MSRRAISWLYSELPDLIQRGILTPETGEALRNHYGPADRNALSGRKIFLWVFGVFGASLVGLGLILLFGSNWENLPRPLRAFLSLALLVSSQAISYSAIQSGGCSSARREGSAVFQSLCVGLCIALIGQTYNIPGNLASFLFSWMLLILPLAYLMQSGVVSAFYLTGITWWAGVVQIEGNQALAFWFLFAMFLPYFFWVIRKDRYSWESSWLSWLICLCLSVGTGISLEKAVPGLWIVVYLGLFGCFYLAGRTWWDESDSIWARPFHAFGAGGIFAISMLLTYKGFWDSVGWYHYRYEKWIHPWAAWMDYILSLTLPFASIFLLVNCYSKLKDSCILYGIAPILGIVCYCSSSLVPSVSLALSLVVFNIYVLALGLATFRLGVLANNLTRMNGGLIILVILIGARFLDTGLGFLLRGIGFILLGTAFLAANLWVGTRKEAEG
ncbi:MAG: DUF2157 domain-containing protein [Candidatus Omnitrophica bacterium]|nr:DUF2157 domain-containing protein [Candidatus Omnitrophota bacterium]